MEPEEFTLEWMWEREREVVRLERRYQGNKLYVRRNPELMEREMEKMIREGVLDK